MEVMNISNIVPNSLEAEQSIIGSIIIDPASINGIVELIKPIHFYNRSHSIIYTAMTEMIASKHPVDLITLSDYLERKNLLEEAGGFVYLADISKNTPSSANAIAYCNTVIDRWNGRQILSACHSGADMVREGKCYEEVRKGLYDALEGLFKERGENEIAGAESLCDEFISELERLQKYKGGLTGYLIFAPFLK